MWYIVLLFTFLILTFAIFAMAVKILFKKEISTPDNLEDNLRVPSLMEDIEKTRIALDIAYAGFDNATDPDMIDCYIYELNAAQLRYQFLLKSLKNF